jgi:Carbohydrate-selective porin, OprB family
MRFPILCPALKLSGIFISLAILAAHNPALANSLAAEELPAAISTDLQAASPEQSESQPSKETINPSDRNFQILQGLNNRYQCGIVASQEPISKADFAKNVEVCLQSLEVKLAQNPETVSKEDIRQLAELTNSFRQEIITLNERVQSVETKVAQNSNNSSFSTTTKLVGEVILGLNGFGGAPAPNSSNTTFSNRVRLNFDTSFTGKDRLRTRLQARNTTPFNTAVTGTNTTRLGFDGSEDNSSFVSLLQYKTPIGDKSNVVIETVGSEFNENMYTFNPLLAGAGTGSISRFGRFNPVYRQSGDGAAATVDYKLTDKITGSIAYAVPGTTSANPATNNGIFGGSNALISQLRFQATPEIDLGLVYARSYHTAGTGITGSTGTAFANNPFGGARTSANHYNFLASAKVAPGFVVSGWAGVTNATRETAAGGTADIFNYAISAAFPDLGGKGNTLGFILGGPPKVTNNAVAARVDATSPLHIEALYKMKFSDNVDITPGLLLITNPDTSTRNTEYVGTIRTTLKF